MPRTITVDVGARSHCHKYSDKIYEHDHDYGNNLDKRRHINKLDMLLWKEAQGLHQKRDLNFVKPRNTNKIINIQNFSVSQVEESQSQIALFSKVRFPSGGGSL